ncbi:reverse transcriptase domain-containing protein [Tanacetum coccineum]|uniref:Reverse transcriptase domain-containing protein n=1 Tax=Tanacetum coccineum TaxID=301880 RepID=A0ABQ4X4Y7_9ASTR
MTLAASTSTDKSLKDFNELMSTPIDFSGYILNGLKIKNLTQKILLGPVFRLLKGTRSNYAELEYDFKECYKALSKKLDWENPEGGDYPFDLSKPLPLIKRGKRQRVPGMKWISEKRMKNQAKNDKIKHGMEEREKDKIKRSKSTPTKVKVKDGAETEENLNGPTPSWEAIGKFNKLLRAYCLAKKCMRTRSSSNLIGNSSSNPTTLNPKCRNRRRSNQRVEPFALEESPVVTMADQHTMAELLRAPTEGYAEAIVVPPILAEHFELKHSLINMMTSDSRKIILMTTSVARRWLEKEPPRSILTWEDLVSKFINEFFPPSRTTNLRNEISNFQQKFDESFHEAWDRYKDLLRACPHHGFTELHQLDTFYNALNPADQDSLNSAAGGNLLERSTQDVLTIIENKSKVRNSRNKSVVSQVKSSDGNSSSSDIAKLTHAVNQQTSAVTTAMTAILKQFQATPPPASVKAVEEVCVTCGGAHPYYQCLVQSRTSPPQKKKELLSCTTEGYAEEIVVPPILVEHFELKHSLINMITSH